MRTNHLRNHCRGAEETEAHKDAERDLFAEGAMDEYLADKIDGHHR
jgi:hypothetical protein